MHARSQPHGRRPTLSQGGAALIMVLTCLVLVTALALALLNRVEADRTSSAAYKGGANSRNLSEYAVNVVMAQITAATTGANAGNAWASQPGAVRVYSATGTNLLNIYKLYSSANMTGDQSIVTGDASTLANWSNNPSLYTDLNAPVNSVYPILDPSATNSVQGFAISGAPSSSASQPAPMPVSWLYVLRDGTLVAPTGTGTAATISGASATNPITGRIAFWTDDETCKVNINTAAGAEWNFASNNTGIAPFLAAKINTPLLANYWDVPMFATLQDNNLTYSQPWRGEYQRFPGHPSTVSLSAVFTNLTTNDIMAIVPRITYTSNGVAVGSQWGTSLSTNTGGTIPSDGGRLYANVDELLYATNRSTVNGPDNPLTTTQINQARFFLTASSRAPDVTMFNTPRMLIWPINVSTNMRTSYDNLMARAIGQLPAQGTTLAAYQNYYFLRSDPLSSTTDYGLSGNTSLLTYFKNLTETPVPGFGGTGILKKYSVYNAKEPDQIRTEIFDYIRCINLQDHSMTTANTYCYSANGMVVPTIVDALSTFGYGRFPTVSKVGLLFWYGQSNAPGPSDLFTNIIGATTNTYTNQTCQIVARLVMETFNPALGYPAMTNISPASGGGYSNVVSGLTNSGFTWGSDTSSMVNMFSANSATYQEDNATNLATWTQIAGRRPIIMSTNNTTAAFATNSPTFIEKSYQFTNGALKATNGTTIYTGVVTTSGGNWGYVSNGISYTVPTTNAYYSNGIVTNINYGTFFFTGGNVSVATYYNGTTIQTINNISLPGANMQLALPSPAMYGSTTLTCLNGTNAWTNGPINGIYCRAANSALYPTNDPGAIVPTDVVLSVQIASSDFRMTPRLGATAPAANYFTNHPAYWSATNSATSGIPCNYAHSFVHLWGLYKGSSMLSNGYYSSTPTFYTNTTLVGASVPSWPNGDMITNSTNGGTTKLLQYGDFDNGYGSASDGPYIGFCDEGTTSTNMNGSGDIPYFPPTINSKQTNLGIGYFSPNRLVPSAGVMGSLPTGVMAGNPWQTLLFRPAALTSATHPGLANPPDYMLLDLFNMPVVQPYAISEALSTAGRINMNYQILPFTWIQRSTAVMAALHPERVVAVPNTIPSALNRKTYTGNNTPAGNNITNRFPLNLDTNTGTLAGFEARFGSNDIFRSAAEICSIPLVPQGVTVTPATINTVMSNWWTSYTYTGENSKERPYARIYPKLTTKSNVYTVHYTVQVLKKLPSGTQDQWDDTKDKVLSTYRGSTMIERFVNPIDASIKDYRSLTPSDWAKNPLPYKFRIISQRQFCP